MAISVDEVTKVITVPKADLTLVSGVTYSFDTDAFRLELRDWEASDAGSWRSVTHTHNQPVDVGGVTLAQVVKIANSYTVTFEDGQYRVLIQGSNNNVHTEANVNQVSLVPNNSAGLSEVGSGLTDAQAAQLTLAASLLEADQVYDKSEGLLHYYARGTTTDLIPAKTIAGTSQTVDASATE